MIYINNKLIIALQYGNNAYKGIKLLICGVIVIKKKIRIIVMISLLSILLIGCNNIDNDTKTLGKEEYSMQNLPKGKFLCDSTSPDGKYLIKAYLSEGSATVNFAVRCELVTKDKKVRNIYWQYREEKAAISWKDNNTVIINDKTIELPNGIYDWRNH